MKIPITFVGECYMHGTTNGEYLGQEDVLLERSTLRGEDGEEVTFYHVSAMGINIC